MSGQVRLGQVNTYYDSHISIEVFQFIIAHSTNNANILKIKQEDQDQRERQCIVSRVWNNKQCLFQKYFSTNSLPLYAKVHLNGCWPPITLIRQISIPLLDFWPRCDLT